MIYRLLIPKNPTRPGPKFAKIGNFNPAVFEKYHTACPVSAPHEPWTNSSGKASGKRLRISTHRFDIGKKQDRIKTDILGISTLELTIRTGDQQMLTAIQGLIKNLAT